MTPEEFVERLEDFWLMVESRTAPTGSLMASCHFEPVCITNEMWENAIVNLRR